MEEKDGTFTCECGNNYAHYRSLRRHLNNCIHGPLYVDLPCKKRKALDGARMGNSAVIKSKDEEAAIENVADLHDINKEKDVQLQQEFEDELNYIETIDLPPTNEQPEEYLEDQERLDKEGDSGYFPFPNMECALLFTWTNLNPRITSRKLKLLLEILHTPGFNVNNLPKTLHFFQLLQKKLPILQVGKSFFIYICL